MDEPRAGCRSCWERLDRFGVFGNEDLHGYLRMAEVETGVNVGVNDSTKPLLASLDRDSDPESPSSPGRARRRRSTIDGDVDVVKLTQGTQGRSLVLRPPRSVAGIGAAFLCILFGGCVGAAVGYWGLYLEPRMLMSEECDSITTIQHLGLDAMHVYKILESFYCHSLRTSTLMEVLCPAVVGVGGAVGALRIAYGQAYFSNWTDEESMIELKRLYSLRTVGTKFVLRCWRMRLSMIFCFQVVVMLWLRYTVDLAMDIEAMRIFLVHKQPWFFTLNLLGVFLGLLWTAYEFYIVITTPGAKIVKTEIFFAGLTLPLLGQHVTYLAILSLYTGMLHPFLFVSTLAEAILESSISSFIQTYAVVFTPLTSAQKTQLYISIFSSFISIGFNGRFATVLLFRVAEITSRATSLALFQAVTRPYGMFVVIAADGIIMSVVTIFFQCQVAKFAPIEGCSFVRQNFFYVIPSVLFCRMAPILEKDTVITVPPVVYYAIRYLELGAMVAVAAEFLDWDLEEAKHLFEDDGFIVAAFVLSTLVMLVLGIIIRSFLSVRTLMDSSVEIWSEDEFNHVQHALKNRVLEDHAADPKAMKVVTKILEQNPTFTSSECHAVAKEAGFPSSAHWDSNFLRAKVVLIIKQALQAVETFDFTRAPNRFRSTLSSRSLVSIRSTRCTLTCNRDSSIVGQMSTDESKQKFVLECVDQSERLTSGQTFQLRALTSGHLIGLVKTEPLTYELRAQSKWEDEAATLFSALLVHQEIYRSAKAFLDLVHMGADLNVGELHRAKGRKRRLSLKDWDPLGWKIYSINGKLATREVVDEILEKGRGSTVARTYSMDSQLDAVENSNALAKSLRPGAEAAARGEYIVQFVRRDSKTTVMAGSEVLLQHAAGWTEAHMGMSEGFSNEDAEGEAVDRVIKAVFVEGESFQGGLAFTLEPAEYGSKDDPSIYQWTAGLIGTLSDTVQLQQSFSEKYRTMTLVACNARSLGLDHVTGILQADHDLHLRIFLSLMQPILQDIRVEYNFGEETLDVEFDVDEAAVNKPLVVAGFHVDDEDELTPAASAGVQLGDQLLMVEVTELDGRMKKITNFQEMRQLLGLSDSEATAVAMTLTFGSQSRWKTEESNETVKKAVAQAESISELLPTWQEIKEGAKRCLERRDFSNLREAVMSRAFLFRAKCDLVQALVTAGFALHHDVFVSKALQLHNRFEPATDRELQNYFEGRDNLQLRDEILIAQLDVLTNTWRSLPQIIKEDVPEVLRSLFRPEVEIVLIREAVKALEEKWRIARGSNSKDEDQNLKMPEELVRFFKYMRPATDESTGQRELSMVWIIKAWSVEKMRQREVQNDVAAITGIYENAESFWEHRVKNAHKRAEEAQELLERAVQKEVIRVVLCLSISDLEKVQAMLSESLMLTKDCKIGDSENVPKGKCLVWSQGIVREKFKPFESSKGAPDLARIRRELPSLYNGKDVRLLFSGLDFDRQHEESQRALDSLQKYIAMAKTAGEAFPSIKQIVDDLSDVLHKSQLFKKDQEAKRKLFLKERELQATMQVAERRLQQVEKEKREIEEKNRKLHEEKGKLEVDTKNVREELGKVLESVALEHAKLKTRVKELETEEKKLKDANAHLWAKQKTMKDALQKAADFMRAWVATGAPDTDVDSIIQLVTESSK